MATSVTPALLTRVDRAWMLSPFAKELAKRRRETTLVDALGVCVTRLLADPTSPGLNLETLNNTGGQPVLSARIDRAFRLILTPLGAREVGLLYFDNHDEAYRWVDRHRRQIPTMLSRVQEVSAQSPIGARQPLVPVIRRDEDDPIALASAAQWRQLLDDGVERYFTYLDEDQRRLAETQARGLLLVKGGAGTGKTAVAIHRALWLARQPMLDGLGPSGVLYLCFNRTLAMAVEQMLRALSGGARPEHLEVRTFHSWCGSLFQSVGAQFHEESAQVEQRTYREYGRLTAAEKAALAPHTGPFLVEEIEQTIKPNGLTSRQEYRDLNRRGRKVKLKQTARDVIWDVYERVRAWQDETGSLTWNDVPARTLAALQRLDDGPRYRAVVIDEGQDCTPVMVRLARRLISEDGQLTVLADPAQEIYDCGFQWTQRELRPRGGNVRWLRTSYRTTRQIHDLARPLLASSEELAEDLNMLEAPVRSGPRPVAIACADRAELLRELGERITATAASRPANQIGVIAPTRKALRQISHELQARGIPHQIVAENGEPLRLTEASVKLLTMYAAKGLDFPAVFIVTPDSGEWGWEPDRDDECRRRLYVALTRSSQELTLALVYGKQHPLVHALDPAALDAAGSCGQAFYNTAGAQDGYGAV